MHFREAIRGRKGSKVIDSKAADTETETADMTETMPVSTVENEVTLNESAEVSHRHIIVGGTMTGKTVANLWRTATCD